MSSSNSRERRLGILSRERRFGLLSREHLLDLSYRQLQQIAKGWSIPCNIKKVHLQEALYRSFHGTPQQVQDVLDRVARERNLNKRMSMQKAAKAKISKQSWTDQVQSVQFNKNLTIQTVVSQKGRIRKAVKRKITYKLAPTRPAIPEETAEVATNTDETPTRILRNTVYPIYDKLVKKKAPRRDPNELLVSSSADVVATRSMVQKLMHDGGQKYSSLSYTKYSAAPNVEYKIQHEYNEPVDFSVKYQTPDTNSATHTTVGNFRPNRPLPLMYRQITLTESYKNCQSNYQNDNSGYPDCQTSFKNGQSSYQNRQLSCKNGQASLQNGQSNFQNEQQNYQNELSCQNGQSGFQNGQQRYQNNQLSCYKGQSSYENGESSYQNEELNYHNGQSSLQCDQLSYQNGQSSYQYCHSSCQNNQSNETHTDNTQNALMSSTQSSDYDSQNRDFYSPNQQYQCAQNLYALRYSNQEQIQFTNIQSSDHDSYDTVNALENSTTFANSDKAVDSETYDPTSKYYHKKIRIERRLSEQHGYVTPDRDANAQNDTVQYADQETAVPNYIASNPDSTVGDVGAMEYYANTYENMSIVNPDIHVNTTYAMYVKESVERTNCVTEFSNALPAISGVFPKYSRATQTCMSPVVEIDSETDNSMGREDAAIQTEDVIFVEATAPPIKRDGYVPMKISITPDDSSELKEEFKPPLLPRHAIESQYGDPDVIIDLDTIASRVNSPWSDVGASVTVRAPSPSWDDVMGLISQDGFQVYVSAHVDNVQCACCTWNGERTSLEHHLKQEHIDEIVTYRSHVTFKYSLSLGALMREKRRAVLVRWYGKFHVLLIKYDDPEWVSATVALLSPHGDSPILQSSVTVYNKQTGEPFKWDGPILTSNLIFHSNPTAHLKLQLSKLGLDPNIGQILLWNGQVDSQEETGCGNGGNTLLDEINVDFHVELSD